MALTEKQLIDDIKSGHLKPVYLLMGEENYFIDRVSNWVEQNVVDPTLRDFDQSVVYGRDVETMANVVSMAQRYPMMSPVRLVLVKEAQDLKKDWESLERYLKNPMPQTLLVLCYRHKKLDKRTSVYRAIQSAGGVFESNRIYDNQLPAWIQSEATAHGHPVDDRCARLLADSIGNELSRVANELGKLYPLLPAGAPIDARIIEEQIGISREFNIFELQKAIGHRDALMCNRIIRYFAANPKANPIQPMLSVLYGWVIKVMIYHQLENKSDAAKVLGVPPTFVRDYQEAARNFTLGKLATCVGYLYEADLRSKGVRNSGAVTDAELMKELVFKMIH